MRTRLLAVISALVVAGALIAIAVQPRSPTRSANTFVNPAGLIDAFSTPTLVLNPRRPADRVVVYRQDRPQFSASLSWSADGGRTWHTHALPLPSGDKEAFFPDAAFAPDGTLYVTYVTLAGRGNVPATLLVSRSGDGGRSLSTPVPVSGANAFQPRLVVGSDGAVHLTWLQVVVAAGARLRNAPVVVVATESTDGARTFTPPVRVSPVGDDVTSPVPVVGGNGGLVVAYYVLGPIAPGGRGTEISQLVVSHANSGGGGFSTPVVVDDHVVSHQISDLFDNLYPSLAAAPGEGLYLAWSTKRSGVERVLVSHSRDGGAHWSAPHGVGGLGPSAATLEYLPSVAVAIDGRVDVIFLANSHDAFTDVELASSSDGGVRYQDRRLSSASFDARSGPTFGPGLAPDLGSHLGLVSKDGSAIAAWTDSRLGNSTNGRQDIVTAQENFPAPISGRWALLLGALLAFLTAAAVAGSIVASTHRPRRGRTL